MPVEFTSLDAILNHGFDTLIDVRSPAEFAEDHIPGAINLPFAENLVDGRFRSTDQLQARFQSAAVDDNTVWYCGSGVSACHNLLAAEAAGFGVGKLYVGSWSGWSSDDNRGVEVG